MENNSIYENRQKYPIRGIDISAWQGIIDMKKILSKDFGFVIIRMFDSISLPQIDIRFQTNWRNFKGKVPRGCYFYFRSTVDPIVQAKAVISNLSMAGDDGELPVFIDLEENKAKLSQLQYWKNVCECIKYIERQKIRKVGIYTSPGFWGGNVPSPLPSGANYININDGRLKWVAHYGVFSPTIPRNWLDVDFWQVDGMTNNYGSYYGTTGSIRLDLNVFMGDKNRFRSRTGVDPRMTTNETADDFPYSISPTSSVAIRTQPSTTSATAGFMNIGSTWTAYNKVNDTSGLGWLQITADDDINKKWVPVASVKKK